MGNSAEKKEKNKSNLKGFGSMKITMVLVNIVAVIVTVIVLAAVTIPKASKEISTLAQDMVYDEAVAYGIVISELYEEYPEPTYEQFAEMLGDVNIGECSTSYAYLVSKDGTMLYHPTQDKVGNPVENEVVKGVVAELTAGKHPNPEFVSYLYKGAQKYAGYSVTSGEQQSILVVTADEDDVLSSIKSFEISVVVAGIIIVILASLLAWFIGTVMMKPLLILTDVVNKTADFNFESNPQAHGIMLRKDESGQIGRAIQKMRGNLRDIVGQIDVASTNISGNADNLKDSTNQVNENSSDNSATAQQLAAGMEETSATTQNITASIANVSNDTSEINKLTVDGEQIAKEIQVKAENLEHDVAKMRQETEEMYATVRDKSAEAVEQSKAVNKINDLAKSIMEIAGQTSLLALNASIEAARAGESGRGFAVVAEEIGNLANQSSETVNGITAIVNEVHQAVDNMSDCINKMQDFLENKVIKDYDQFTDVSQQYNNDAHVFQVSMQDIHIAMDNLTNNITDITEAIDGINNTIGESAIGVTDIAQKTTDIVTLSSQTYDLVEESVGYAGDLRDIVSRFKME